MCNTAHKGAINKLATLQKGPYISRESLLEAFTFKNDQYFIAGLYAWQNQSRLLWRLCDIGRQRTFWKSTGIQYHWQLRILEGVTANTVSKSESKMLQAQV